MEKRPPVLNSRTSVFVVYLGSGPGPPTANLNGFFSYRRSFWGQTWPMREGKYKTTSNQKRKIKTKICSQQKRKEKNRPNRKTEVYLYIQAR